MIFVVDNSPLLEEIVLNKRTYICLQERLPYHGLAKFGENFSPFVCNPINVAGFFMPIPAGSSLSGFFHNSRGLSAFCLHASFRRNVGAGLFCARALSPKKF